MPVRNKTYNFVTPTPAGVTQRPVPENPNRVSLVIQNTGAQPGQVRFGAPNLTAAQDFTWAAGQFTKWDQADTCPLDSVNLNSAAATTWTVMEGIRAAVK